MKKSLVIGTGEIGTSLKNVLLSNKELEVDAIDIKDSNFKEFREAKKKYDTLHVCFGYSHSFIPSVLEYVETHSPSLVIIHSTVQVYTTEKIRQLLSPGVSIVHSPVRGQHPNLEKSLLTFVKYIGADDGTSYELAKEELESSGMNCKRLSGSRVTELGKILCTSYYGVIIAWHREMKRICDSLGVDYEQAVTEFNTTYNEGYSVFRPNVIRPVLTPPEGKIGGHCVVPNANILKELVESEFLNLIY
jgi:UDP-N-acetyl-D-mannosaminuronate dehydrogenase